MIPRVRDVMAAYLLSQLEQLQEIVKKRLICWQAYQEGFASLQEQGVLQCPVVPEGAEHNGAIYYILTGHAEERDALRTFLKSHHIETATHYQPLHCSPAGTRWGRHLLPIGVCEDIERRLVRLPLYEALTVQDVKKVVSAIQAFYVSSTRV